MKPVRIYSLPRTLSEEEIATIMAKCARSPEPFDEIAKTVTTEGAAQFHEKYVVNYGHASVAEIAVPNFCFEGVSILASKILESMPRGAYQEKSTRAQNFLFKDEAGRYTAYFIPRDHLSEEALTLYVKSQEGLFACYEQLREPLANYVQKVMGEQAKEKASFAAQRRAFDSLRYLLPVGTQTNLGMRLNGRDTGILISKMLASRIPEFRFLGERLKIEAMDQIPTLVRHVEPSQYLQAQEEIADLFTTDITSSTMEPVVPKNRNYAKLMVTPNDKNAVHMVALTFMAHHGIKSPFELTPYEQHAQAIVQELLKRRGEHDPVPEELGVVPTSWDLVMDYGAYRDLQRHRRCKQYPQLPTIEMGYDIPDDIIDAGLERPFRQAINAAAENVLTMKRLDPDHFSYLYMIPLAFRHRMVWQSTLEQDFYVIELRSPPQGHISYRRIVAEMWRELGDALPTFWPYIRCNEVP